MKLSFNFNQVSQTGGKTALLVQAVAHIGGRRENARGKLAALGSVVSWEYVQFRSLVSCFDPRLSGFSVVRRAAEVGPTTYFAGPPDLMRVAFAASLAAIAHTASGYYVCMYQCVRSPPLLTLFTGLT